MTDIATIFLQDHAWHMGDGWGWWMLFGWLWMLVFWGLVIWAVVYFARRVGRSDDMRSRSTALDILEERYARGEITDEEFETRRARILQAPTR